MNYNEKSPENSKTLSKTPDRIKEHSISDIFEQKAVEENDIHINFHSTQLKKKKYEKKVPKGKIKIMFNLRIIIVIQIIKKE